MTNLKKYIKLPILLVIVTVMFPNSIFSQFLYRVPEDNDGGVDRAYHNVARFHYLGLSSKYDMMQLNSLTLSSGNSNFSTNSQNLIESNYGIKYYFNTLGTFEAEPIHHFYDTPIEPYPGTSELFAILTLNYASFAKNSIQAVVLNNNLYYYSSNIEAKGINTILCLGIPLKSYYINRLYCKTGISYTNYLGSTINETITNESGNFEENFNGFRKGSNKLIRTSKINSDLKYIIGLNWYLALKYMNTYDGKFEGEYNYLRLELDLNYQFNLLKNNYLNKNGFGIGLNLIFPLPLYTLPNEGAWLL